MLLLLLLLLLLAFVKFHSPFGSDSATRQCCKRDEITCRLLIYIIQLHRKREAGERRKERRGWVNKEKCT